MARVQLTRPARDDLNSIWQYIARDNPPAADSLIDEFFARCALYAAQPNAGAPADKFQPGMRHFTIGSYVVFYRPEQSGILVIRVLHGARNIEEVFRQSS